ncbi:acetoacetate decarboxylase family protein [Hyalangium versicolor]|uniref:acetoacetate decarboxylase family protein n=1 Tax=Hyalangium versicolor TaxID=2861190 RepID=UPI001CCF8792|nr:acetoacetate decarboxylase family protein [Hyalangium versicolor]
MQTSTPGPSLFEAYPPSEQYELSSGVVCDIPYVCRSVDFLVLHGTAELEVVRKLLAGQRYQAVSVGGGKVAAALWLADYHDTSCGPYKEFILSFPASLKSLESVAHSPMELLMASALPEGTIFCQKLILNQQVPIDYGREVHGHAKHPTPQPVDISFSTSGCRFNVSCDGKRVAFGQVRLPEEPAAVQRASFGFVTAKEVFQTRNVMHFEFEARFRLFGDGDEFSLSSDSALGKDLSDMRFTPQVVQYLPKARFVMPKPLNWRGPKEQR